MTSPGTIIGWRAWDDTGAVHDSHHTSWAALPDDGILVVMIYYADRTKRIMSGTDYYFMAQHAEGPIYAASNDQPDPKRYRALVVKRGRWAPDHIQARVEQDANASTWEMI